MNKQELLALYGHYRFLCDEYGWKPSGEGFNAFVKIQHCRLLWTGE